MKQIAVISTSRADYYLLKPLALRLAEFSSIEVSFISIIISRDTINKDTADSFINSRYSSLTYHEFFINQTSDDYQSISMSIVKAQEKLSLIFDKNDFNLIVILGDRIELFSIVVPAILRNIPIAHIHGGEKTLGAIDEIIRHSITKLSNLHFASTDTYRKRIIQMGENPSRVFNFGSIGVDIVKNKKIESVNSLESKLNLDLSNDYAVVTYHPETKDPENQLKFFNDLIIQLNNLKSIRFIITKSNVDYLGLSFNQILDSIKSPNVSVVDKLGEYYLDVVNYSKMVIGNSSSGIIEAPSLGIPTLNIGKRQSGRVKAKSVINSDNNPAEIAEKIQYILTHKFDVDDFVNPYEKRNTIEKISQQISDSLDRGINIVKDFHDLKGV